MHDESKNQQQPQGGHREETTFGGLLAAASDVAARVLASVQAVAGTTFCKGVQVNALHKFAIEAKCWIESPDSLGVYVDRGAENEVYMSTDRKTVFKLNDFRYADDNLASFFERIKVHNSYFPECAYSLIGFSRNRDGKVCAVLSQAFIHAEREATDDEIAKALAMMGFKPCLDGEYYSNGQYDIFDALPNNVLLGQDGELYFIDTIIYRSKAGNMSLYKSLSPRF